MAVVRSVGRCKAYAPQWPLLLLLPLLALACLTPAAGQQPEPLVLSLASEPTIVVHALTFTLDGTTAPGANVSVHHSGVWHPVSVNGTTGAFSTTLELPLGVTDVTVLATLGNASSTTHVRIERLEPLRHEREALPLIPLLVVGAIFAGTYLLLITEKVHRTIAAMFGALLMVITGYLVRPKGQPFFGVESAFESIDFNTIALLLGMMIIVGVLSETGVFQYLAIKAAQRAKGDYWRIMVLFVVLTASLSSLLDNVTTVLFMVPITVSIARRLKVPVVPLIMAEVFASNIGGTATLIGDPPNIIIGNAVGISFNEFVYHQGVIIALTTAAALFFLRWQYGKELRVAPTEVERVLALDASKEIRNPMLLRRGVVVLIGVIGLFASSEFLKAYLHPELPVGVIALGGAAVLLIMARLDIEKIVLAHIEWPTLLFFAGLFVLVGGVEHAGLLRLMGEGIASLTGGNLLVTILLVIWLSAFASAVIDNIPFTATMIPIVLALSAQPALAHDLGAYAINPLWWALSIGACLGGNGTLVGASANLVAVGIAGRAGVEISFKSFLRQGMPFMLFTTAVATVLLVVFLQVPGWYLR